VVLTYRKGTFNLRTFKTAQQEQHSGKQLLVLLQGVQDQVVAAAKRSEW
jgi:hypothetical protein